MEFIRKKYKVCSFIIVVLAILVRIYKIDGPIADWHSFRQADTASVARIYMTQGIDILRPRYHDLSNIQSGNDNPNGWRMVEFPFYQVISVILQRIIPSLSIEISLRIVTIASSIGVLLLIMYLSKLYFDEFTALLVGIVFSCLPYCIYYSRAVLPEMTAVFFVLLSIAIYARSKKIISLSFVLACFFASLALLIKPTSAFLLASIPFVEIGKKSKFINFLINNFIFFSFCIMPLLFWRKWISYFPEGIPVFLWLFNEGNIRFKGAWFHWLFARRLAELILGYWGTVPFYIGLLALSMHKKYLWLFGNVLGVLIYFVVIARGNVQHDYYQIISLPMVSILTGVGFSRILQSDFFGNKWVRSILSAAVFVAMCAFGWFTIRTYYWINNSSIIIAGNAADSLLPVNAKVIAPYNGDTTFLYQTKRVGWPIGFDIDKKIKMGATHYVTISSSDNDLETKELANTYTVLVRNDTYAIIDLTKKKL